MRGALGVGLVAAALAVGTGCSVAPDPLCPPGADDFVPGVSCEEVGVVERWIERLSARPLTDTQRQKVLTDLAARAGEDGAGVRDAMARAQGALDALDQVPAGLDAARARATANFEAHRGGGPFPKAEWPEIDAVRDASAAIWTTDDGDRLALTEMDIEGWIRFASLCREVQGGTPLKLSIADRVPAYHAIVARFDAGPTADRLGMVAIGGGWRWMSARWRRATFDAQQTWMGSAPLPGPMTGTSRDYLDAVTLGSPAAHATAIEIAFGPLPLVDP